MRRPVALVVVALLFCIVVATGPAVADGVTSSAECQHHQSLSRGRSLPDEVFRDQVEGSSEQYLGTGAFRNDRQIRTQTPEPARLVVEPHVAVPDDDPQTHGLESGEAGDAMTLHENDGQEGGC